MCFELCSFKRSSGMPRTTGCTLDGSGQKHHRSCVAKEWCSDLKRMELVSTIGLPSVLVFVVQVRSAERGSLPDGRSEIAESILRTLTRVQKSLLGCRNQIQGGSHASKRINGVLKVLAVPDMRCQAPQSFTVMTCLHKTCERKYHLQTGALDSS